MRKISSTVMLIKPTFYHEYRSYQTIFFRIVLYSLIIYILSLSFRIVSNDSERIFYIFLVQTLIASFVPSSFDIYNELQTDLFAIRCIKPVHYIFYKTVNALSLFLFRFLTLLIPCSLITYLQTDQLPFLPEKLPILIFTCFIAAVIYHFITCTIGLCSYWVKDVKVLFYLNFTTMFSFGGLLVSVEDYPKILKYVSLVTPYPWILSYPADTANYSLVGLCTQISWVIALAITCFWVFLRVRQSQFTTG